MGIIVKTTVINRASQKLFLLLVFHLMGLAAGQNCGVPSLINVKPSDKLVETLDKGQSLVKIEARNVVGIAGVLKNPGGFAKVTLEKGKPSSFINLEVFKPLWDRNTNVEPQKSYIDTHRAENVEVTINLTCQDGNHKVIEICIPIKDENTENPRFSQAEYHLTTEPCFTGRCTMLFDEDIIVIDEDRDEKNALLDVKVDMDSKIEIISDFDKVEPWYEEDSSSLVMYKKGFQKQIRLAYTPIRNQWLPTCRINFTLTAWNQLEHVSDLGYEAKAVVHITFQEKPGRIFPPLFSSSFYHAVAKRQFEWLMMKPEPIYATVPWNDDSIISYDVVEGRRDVLEIHKNGTVRFIGDPDELKFVRVRTVIPFDTNHALPFVIQATRKKVIDGMEHEAKTNASLTIFIYHDHDECSTKPPDICPPLCPEPEPSPDPSTRPPITIPTADPPVLPTSGSPSTTTTDLAPSSSTSPPDETDEPTTTEETETPPTTDQTEPSTERSTDPSSTSFPTSTSPSTETPTTHPATGTHPPTTTTYHTTTTNFPPWSTSASTGFPESSTTTSSTPTSSTSPTSESSLPTEPPGGCECDCDNFTCRNPQTEPSANFTYFSLYPDPFECTKFHICLEGEYTHPGIPIVCNSGEVFCPPTAHYEPCTTVDTCLERTKRLVYPFSIKGYGYVGSGEDEPCEGECRCRTGGILPGDPRNLCNDSNYNLPFPDPEFCDIFHKCQSTDDGNYIDYPMKCVNGLIFCPYYRTCVRYGDYEHCNDACLPNKTLKQCDTCIMGNWPGFDVFLKRFTNFNLTS